MGRMLCNDMMGKPVFLIVVINLISVSSLEGPLVVLPDGMIQGTWEHSLNGKIYSAFQGIPYAKPPELDLRFEEAKPIEPWEGIRQARTSYWCTQKDSTSFSNTLKIIGREDCLHLNVYVPGGRIDRNKSFDVLVEIHGGAFMFGSSMNTNNPSYVMDTLNDIIIVLINYRLGLFGFLSTEDDAIPGNNGMKDQVLALKWIRKNIEYFGGNPNSVTLSGHSSGAACVHLHTLSPMSRGLFHKAHLGSGSASIPSVIKEKPLEFAKKLAALSGCPTEPTHSLKQCLKTRPASLLMSSYNQFYGYKRMPFSPFAVVVEKKSENPFLSKLPNELIKEGQMADLPLIFSVVRDEGIYPAGYYCKEPGEIEPVWEDVAHYLLDYNYTLPLDKRKAQEVKHLYLGPGVEFSKNTFFELTKIFSDRFYIIAAEVAAKLHSVATKSPVYFFYFNYKSPNVSTSALYCEKGDIGGIAHAADQVYFFGFNMTKYLSKSDERIKAQCHHMYSSFAKTGVPSFDSINGSWRPTRGYYYLTYLNISSPDDMRVDTTRSLSQYTDFWRKYGLAENERDVFVTKDNFSISP